MHSHLAALLARQHGHATPGQARELGMTKGQVDGLIRRGRLLSPARGLLQAPGAASTPESEAMAALLRCGPSARLIGPRALALLGIRGFSRHDAFGVLVGGGHDPRNRPDLRTFRDAVPDDATALVQGLAIPGPPRLLVEMPRFAEGAALRAAVDAAAWAKRPGRRALSDAAFALPSRYWPAARIRDLARAGHLDLDSEPERRLVRILSGRFGAIETQVWVSPRHRVDVLLRSLRLVLEYDGADHRSDAGRQADEVRDEELEDLGFDVVHLHHEDLTDPAAVLARIATVLERRDSVEGRASAAWQRIAAFHRP